MRRLVSAVSLVLAFSVLTVPTAQGVPDRPSLGRAQDLLWVCTDAPYEPYEVLDPSTPTGFAGFDIDLMSAIARTLGRTLVVSDTTFDAIQSAVALNSGACDVAASAMTITDSRVRDMRVVPYLDQRQAILVRNGTSYSTWRQLRGKKVAVLAGTWAAGLARKHLDRSQITMAPSSLVAMEALRSRHVVAVIDDLATCAVEFRKGDVHVTRTFSVGKQLGLGVRLANPELQAQVAEALGQVRASGEYDAIYRRWLTAN